MKWKIPGCEVSSANPTNTLSRNISTITPGSAVIVNVGEVSLVINSLSLALLSSEILVNVGALASTVSIITKVGAV